MRPVLALLALALLAPLPAASAQSPYAVDVTVELVSATEAVERHVFSYDGGRTRWTLIVPDDATFVRAYDATTTLSATVEGDQLLVDSRRSPFTVEYRRAPQDDPPFTRLATQVASAPDSPTSVRVALPAGWSLVGQKASDEASVDAQGVLRATGPQAAEFLLLPPGRTDPGPDPRVLGEAALREAVVDVTRAAATMTLTVLYDTDVYSRDWTISVPTNATLRAVRTPWGDVPFVVESGSASFTLPYPAGYGLGARPFDMAFDLRAPETHGGAFLKVHASVPAADGDVVAVAFRVADDLLPTGIQATDAALVDLANLTARGVGPVAATLSVLPPVPAGQVRFTQGPFVVQAPAELETPARVTAKAAADMLPDVASFAGGARVERPFHVAYTDAPIFDWEEGFYSPGLNTISIRTSELRNATGDAPRLKPVQVLVHETTHGLLDRMVRGGPGDLSFFQEGLARLAETKVELRMADQVLDCRTSLVRQECSRHSARPDAPRVQDLHRAGYRFDATWTAGSTPPDQRGFLYDYSGMILHHYERESPPGAIDAALADIAAAPGPDDRGLAAVRFVDALLLQSPALARDALLHPGAEAARLSLEEFRHCTGPLVSPPFPFDPEPRAPPGGCPAPAPPTQEERDGLTRAPTQPMPTVPSFPVGGSTPTRVVPVSPGETPGPSGETAGGLVEGVEVPGAGVVLAVAALGIVAMVRRRRGR